MQCIMGYTLQSWYSSPRLFPSTCPIFRDLRFSGHFRNFSKPFLFWGIFSDSVQETQTLVSTKTLFNYFSLSYFVLALTSAITYLPNITLISFRWLPSTEYYIPRLGLISKGLLHTIIIKWIELITSRKILIPLTRCVSGLMAQWLA